MMSSFRSLIPARTLVAVAFCLALLLPACSKKAARTTPPVLVPSIEAETQTPTEPQPAPAPAASATPEPETPSPAPSEAQKPKPKPHKPVARKPATPAIEAPKAEPAKVETLAPAPVPAAPATSVQITADVPRAAVQSQTQTTEQLLRSSEAKLATLGRDLSASEQAMQRQARNYISQSNEAVRAGDIERAYNLAVKASLLANELAK
jgi:outer membrane biosynthesis protein TonB